MILHKQNWYHALRALGFGRVEAFWFALWHRKPSDP